MKTSSRNTDTVISNYNEILIFHILFTLRFLFYLKKYRKNNLYVFAIYFIFVNNSFFTILFLQYLRDTYLSDKKKKESKNFENTYIPYI